MEIYESVKLRGRLKARSFSTHVATAREEESDKLKTRSHGTLSNMVFTKLCLFTSAVTLQVNLFSVSSEGKGVSVLNVL